MIVPQAGRAAVRDHRQKQNLVTASQAFLETLREFDGSLASPTVMEPSGVLSARVYRIVVKVSPEIAIARPCFQYTILSPIFPQKFFVGLLDGRTVQASQQRSKTGQISKTVVFLSYSLPVRSSVGFSRQKSCGIHKTTENPRVFGGFMVDDTGLEPVTSRTSRPGRNLFGSFIVLFSYFCSVLFPL